MVHFAAASNTGTSLLSWKRRAGATAMVLVAAFIWGFAAETTSLFDQFWPGMLLMGALVLLLAAVLAASFGKNVRLLTAVMFGMVAGCLAGVMLVLGASSPFALELGERDLTDLGGDLAWKAALAAALIAGAGVGSLVGAVCGTAAWALVVTLGEKPSDRARTTKEAGR